jgi:hypothetical protein
VDDPGAWPPPPPHKCGLRPGCDPLSILLRAQLAVKTLATTVAAAAHTTAASAAKHAANVRAIARALMDATATDIMKAAAAAAPPAAAEVAALASSRATASKAYVGAVARVAEEATLHATFGIQVSTDAATAWRESVVKQGAGAAAAAKLAIGTAAHSAIDFARIAQTGMPTAQVAAAAAATTAATVVKAAQNVQKVAAAATVASKAGGYTH